jgi:hypothetical protein
MTFSVRENVIFVKQNTFLMTFFNQDGVTSIHDVIIRFGQGPWIIKIND